MMAQGGKQGKGGSGSFTGSCRGVSPLSSSRTGLNLVWSSIESSCHFFSDPLAFDGRIFIAPGKYFLGEIVEIKRSRIRRNSERLKGFPRGRCN